MRHGCLLHGQYIHCECSVKTFTECELRHNASLMLRVISSVKGTACLGLMESLGTLWPPPRRHVASAARERPEPQCLTASGSRRDDLALEIEMPPAPFQILRVSTETLPERDRFSAFQVEVAQKILRVDIIDRQRRASAHGGRVHAARRCRGRRRQRHPVRVRPL
jgi:hypothetical protein